MRYSQIVDGLPTPPQQLPMSFADVSNFHTLPDEILANYGWYPYAQLSPPSYNDMTERLLPGYAFNGTSVTTDWQVIPLSAEEQLDRVSQTIETLGQSVQAHLDFVARERRYDSISSACGYATSSFPRYQAEGQACMAWRDAVWPLVESILDDVQAGNRAIPTSQELIAELPEVQW